MDIRYLGTLVLVMVTLSACVLSVATPAGGEAGGQEPPTLTRAPGTAVAKVMPSATPTPADINSPTPAPSPTCTQTVTPTSSHTLTPTCTATDIPTLTATVTPSVTPKPEPTPTAAHTAVAEAPAHVEAPTATFQFLPKGEARLEPGHPCPGCPRAPGYIIGNVFDAGDRPLCGVRVLCYNDWHRYPVVGTKGGGEYDIPVMQAFTSWKVSIVDDMDQPLSPEVAVPFDPLVGCWYRLDWQRVN